ncbi:hypothetical protein P0F11_003041 [Vibrio metschnikovii]|nr:hypothetical protein [Vibrio metschnikovii]
MKGLITIVCYNRIIELQRLLSCLNNAEVQGFTLDLVISIDKSDKQNDIVSICENFDWEFGTKSIVARNNNLGLKSHVLTCMSLVVDYDFNVVLEDDLILSPYFVNYIESCLSSLNGNDSIGMYSLYAYNKKESDKTPFYPLVDSFDAYYMQFPSSWGFFITNTQWEQFDSFLLEHDCDDFEDEQVPLFVSSWSSSSWKKHFCRYLVKENKLVLFPRYSLTSNSGADGSHEAGIGTLYSVPLVLGNRDWEIPSINESKSVYDVNFNLRTSLISEYDSVYSDGFSLGSFEVVNKAEFISLNNYVKLNESLGILWFTINRYLKKINHKIFRK